MRLLPARMSILQCCSMFVSYASRQYRRLAWSQKGKSGLIWILLIKRVMYTMSAIVKKLQRIACMFFIIRTYLPLFKSGFFGIHGQIHPIINYRGNGVIRNIAISGEEVAFMYKERILKDLRNMTNVLVIGGVNVHMLVYIFVTPVGHIRSASLSMICSAIVYCTCCSTQKFHRNICILQALQRVLPTIVLHKYLL